MVDSSLAAIRRLWPRSAGPEQPSTPIRSWIRPTSNQNTAYQMPDGRIAYHAQQPTTTATLTPSTGPTGTPARPNAAGSAAAGGTQIPFDAQFAQMLQQLQMQKSRFESDAAAGDSDLARQWGLAKRDMSQQVPDATRQLLESFAGRGMAYSSGYATEQANQQRDIAQSYSDLDNEYARGKSEMTRQRNLFNNEYSSTLASEQAAAAARLASRAGSLGLGRPRQIGPGGPTPNPARTGAIAGLQRRPVGITKSPVTAQSEQARKWAAYVKYNPTNAARVAAAKRKLG